MDQADSAESLNSEGGASGAETHEDQLHEWERQRLAKVERLRAENVEPYARSFPDRTPLADIVENYGYVETGQTAEGTHFRVAGRVMSRRRHGKSLFLNLRDDWCELQVYSNVNTLGEASFERLTDVDLGDIIGCEGHVFRTRTGELTVFAESWILLTKALRPLPEKWHGLQDRETRYRQRYVDLISNPEVARQLRGRGKLVSAMRRYLEDQGFEEVETPTLQPLPGGANARPFVTHHNALDADLYLRIAPELYLKRLLVGGYDQDLRDLQELPQRGHLPRAQSRVHHDGALLGLRGLQRHHGVGREHGAGSGRAGRRLHRDHGGRADGRAEGPVAAAHHRLAAARVPGHVALRDARRSAGGEADAPRPQDRRREPRFLLDPGRQGAQARRLAEPDAADLRDRLPARAQPAGEVQPRTTRSSSSASRPWCAARRSATPSPS